MRKKRQAAPSAGYPAYVLPNASPRSGKPWYKRKRIIIPSLLLLAAAGASGNKQDQPTQQTAASTTSTPVVNALRADSTTSSSASSSTSETAPIQSSAAAVTSTVSSSSTVPTSTSSAAVPVVLYASCDEARDAGVAPLRKGDRGYTPELDRDGDGIACEPVVPKATKVAPSITYAAPKPNTPKPTAAAGLVGGGGGGSTYYANCKAVRAAGAAPIHRGEPGYSSKLDRDGDGVACE